MTKILNRYRLLYKTVALTVSCLFFINNVSFSSDISSSVTTLPPQLRIHPFFESNGLHFRDIFALMCAAGELRDLIDSENARAANVERINKSWFPGGDIWINRQLRRKKLRSTGREYRYAVFDLKNENRKIVALFTEGHQTLTGEEKRELGISVEKDENTSAFLRDTKMRGVLFLAPAEGESSFKDVFPPDLEKILREARTELHSTGEVDIAAIGEKYGLTEKQMTELALELQPGQGMASSESATPASDKLREISAAWHYDNRMSIGRIKKDGSDVSVPLSSVFIETGTIEKIEENLDDQETHWINVVGDAGIGKSSIIWHLYEKYKGSHEIFPVVLDVSRPDYVEGRLTAENIIAASLEQGDRKTVVFVDTLDYQVGLGRMEQVLGQIRELTRKGIKVVSFVRPPEYNRISQRYSGGNIPDIRVDALGFTDDNIRHALKKYVAIHYGLNADDPKIKDEVNKLVSNDTFMDLSRNPLHMAMAFSVFSPDKVPTPITVKQLYDEFWNKKVSGSRFIYGDDIGADKSSDMVLQKENIARYLAWKMLNSRKLVLKSQEYSSYVKGWLDAWKDLESENVIKVSKDGAVEFFHQTFFEYAAAKALLSHENDEIILQELDKLLNSPDARPFRPVIKQLAIAEETSKELRINILQRLAEHEDVLMKALVVDICIEFEPKYQENDCEQEKKILLGLFENKNWFDVQFRLYFGEKFLSQLLSSNDEDSYHMSVKLLDLKTSEMIDIMLSHKFIIREIKKDAEIVISPMMDFVMDLNPDKKLEIPGVPGIFLVGSFWTLDFVSEILGRNLASNNVYKKYISNLLQEILNEEDIDQKLRKAEVISRFISLHNEDAEMVKNFSKFWLDLLSDEHFDLKADAEKIPFLSVFFNVFPENYYDENISSIISFLLKVFLNKLGRDSESRYELYALEAMRHIIPDNHKILDELVDIGLSLLEGESFQIRNRAWEIIRLAIQKGYDKDLDSLVSMVIEIATEQDYSENKELYLIAVSVIGMAIGNGYAGEVECFLNMVHENNLLDKDWFQFSLKMKVGEHGHSYIYTDKYYFIDAILDVTLNSINEGVNIKGALDISEIFEVAKTFQGSRKFLFKVLAQSLDAIGYNEKLDSILGYFEGMLSGEKEISQVISILLGLQKAVDAGYKYNEDHVLNSIMVILDEVLDEIDQSPHFIIFLRVAIGIFERFIPKEYDRKMEEFLLKIMDLVTEGAGFNIAKAAFHVPIMTLLETVISESVPNDLKKMLPLILNLFGGGNDWQKAKSLEMIKKSLARGLLLDDVLERCSNDTLRQVLASIFSESEHISNIGDPLGLTLPYWVDKNKLSAESDITYRQEEDIKARIEHFLKQKDPDKDAVIAYREDAVAPIVDQIKIADHSYVEYSPGMLLDDLKKSADGRLRKLLDILLRLDVDRSLIVQKLVEEFRRSFRKPRQSKNITEALIAFEKDSGKALYKAFQNVPPQAVALRASFIDALGRLVAEGHLEEDKQGFIDILDSILKDIDLGKKDTRAAILALGRLGELDKLKTVIHNIDAIKKDIDYDSDHVSFYAEMILRSVTQVFNAAGYFKNNNEAYEMVTELMQKYPELEDHGITAITRMGFAARFIEDLENIKQQDSTKSSRQAVQLIQALLVLEQGDESILSRILDLVDPQEIDGLAVIRLVYSAHLAAEKFPALGMSIRQKIAGVISPEEQREVLKEEIRKLKEFYDSGGDIKNDIFEVKIGNVVYPNPVFIASTPAAGSNEQLKKSLENGAGAVVLKTVCDVDDEEKEKRQKKQDKDFRVYSNTVYFSSGEIHFHSGKTADEAEHIQQTIAGLRKFLDENELDISRVIFSIASEDTLEGQKAMLDMEKYNKLLSPIIKLAEEKGVHLNVEVNMRYPIEAIENDLFAAERKAPSDAGSSLQDLEKLVAAERENLEKIWDHQKIEEDRKKLEEQGFSKDTSEKKALEKALGRVGAYLRTADQDATKKIKDFINELGDLTARLNLDTGENNGIKLIAKFPYRSDLMLLSEACARHESYSGLTLINTMKAPLDQQHYRNPLGGGYIDEAKFMQVSGEHLRTIRDLSISCVHYMLRMKNMEDDNVRVLPILSSGGVAMDLDKIGRADNITPKLASDIFSASRLMADDIENTLFDIIVKEVLGQEDADIEIYRGIMQSRTIADFAIKNEGNEITEILKVLMGNKKFRETILPSIAFGDVMNTFSSGSSAFQLGTSVMYSPGPKKIGLMVKWLAREVLSAKLTGRVHSLFLERGRENIGLESRIADPRLREYIENLESSVFSNIGAVGLDKLVKMSKLEDLVGNVPSINLDLAAQVAMIDPDLCILCGKCKDHNVCESFDVGGRPRQAVIKETQCTSCASCTNYCEHHAIKMVSRQKSGAYLAGIHEKANAIHSANLDLVLPAPRKSLVLNVIADSLIPDGQKNIMKELEREMRGEKYPEKIVVLDISDADTPEKFAAELEKLRSRMENEYNDYNIEFNVACSDLDMVESAQGMGMRALAFSRQGAPGDIIQLEAIILALRALMSEDLGKFRSVYYMVTGKHLDSNETDINLLARTLLLILPAERIDINDINTINRIMRENILTAA